VTPRLLLEPEAEEEFLEAQRWYAERSPVIADAFRSAVARTLEAVESAPQSFPLAVLDIRKALVRRFPHVVYYVGLAEVTTVIAIIHARRDPRVWQERRRLSNREHG
jgi:plasmid stabilization system protein ParE